MQLTKTIFISKLINIHGLIDIDVIKTGEGKIVFLEINPRPSGSVVVSEIEGVNVTNVSVASSTVSELEIIPFDASGKYIAISTSPHGFVNKNLVSLSGFNTSINSLQGGFNIGVRT